MTTNVLEQYTHALIVAQDAWEEFIATVSELPIQLQRDVVTAVIADLSGTAVFKLPEITESPKPPQLPPKPERVRPAGRAPYGAMGDVVRVAVDVMPEMFIVADVLAKVQEQYPATIRQSVHNHLYRMAEKGTIRVIQRVDRHDPTIVTVYRKVTTKESHEDVRDRAV
jgi:hypothetical protein